MSPFGSVQGKRVRTMLPKANTQWSKSNAWYPGIEGHTLPAWFVAEAGMKNFLAIGSLVVLLGGCGLVAALDQLDREADQRACDGFGFRRGTDAYSNCMMQ